MVYGVKYLLATLSMLPIACEQQISALKDGASDARNSVGTAVESIGISSDKATVSSSEEASAHHDASFTPVGSAGMIIIINDGKPFTNQAQVTLHLTADKAREMYITNQEGCITGGEWKPYAPQIPNWTITTLNAPTFVYGKFREPEGESPCFASPIYVDLIAPRFKTNLGVKKFGATHTTSPELSWEPAADNISGVVEYKVKLGTSKGGEDILPWQTISPSGDAAALIRTTLNGLTLEEGKIYFPTVVAFDGAGNRSNELQGEAFMLGWQEHRVLSPSHTSEGISGPLVAAMSGSTLVLGVPADDSDLSATSNNATLPTLNNQADDSGAAYVYTLQGDMWLLQAYIKATTPEAGDQFGARVAIKGDLLAISASVLTNKPGRIYVYHRDEHGNWRKEATMLGGSPPGENGDLFGGTIALGSDILVASKHDSKKNKTSAFVFRRTPDSTWVFDGELTSSNAHSEDNFGASLAVYENTVVVGAPGNNNSAGTPSLTLAGSEASSAPVPQSGAAHVFKKEGATWKEVAFLKAANAHAGARFGSAVSIERDSIFIAAEEEATNIRGVFKGNSIPAAASDAPGAGAVYVFERTDALGWQQVAFIKAPNNEAQSHFGRCLSASGDTLLVGADGEGNREVVTVLNGETSVLSTSKNNAAYPSPIKQGAGFSLKKTADGWHFQSYFKTQLAPDAQFGSHCSLGSETLGVFTSIGEVTFTDKGVTAAQRNAAVVFQR